MSFIVFAVVTFVTTLWQLIKKFSLAVSAVLCHYHTSYLVDNIVKTFWKSIDLPSIYHWLSYFSLSFDLSVDACLVAAEKMVLRQQFELLFKPSETVHGWKVNPSSAKRLISMVLPFQNRRWKVSVKWVQTFVSCSLKKNWMLLFLLLFISSFVFDLYW